MNDRIVIHPPLKDSKEKYTVTVSYYVDGKRKQKRKSKFTKSKDAKVAGEEIKKLEEKMPVIKATGRESNSRRICKAIFRYYGKHMDSKYHKEQKTCA